MTCPAITYQIISLLFGLAGLTAFFISIAALQRALDIRAEWNRLVSMKLEMLAMFLISIGQIYQGLKEHAMVPLWLKVPLIFMIASAIFARRSMTRTKAE